MIRQRVSLFASDEQSPSLHLPCPASRPAFFLCKDRYYERKREKGVYEVGGEDRRHLSGGQETTNPQVAFNRAKRKQLGTEERKETGPPTETHYRPHRLLPLHFFFSRRFSDRIGKSKTDLHPKYPRDISVGVSRVSYFSYSYYSETNNVVTRLWWTGCHSSSTSFLFFFLREVPLLPCPPVTSGKEPMRLYY